ncbi:MAG: hypothetical protein ACRC2R_09160 [Xenococcaceae cyanobacterium]
MYNLKQPEEDPDQIIEVGIDLISKDCDPIDTDEGVYYLPKINCTVFLEIKKDFTKEELKEKLLDRGFGSSYTIRSIWVCQEQEF